MRRGPVVSSPVSILLIADVNGMQVIVSSPQLVDAVTGDLFTLFITANHILDDTVYGLVSDVR